MKNNIFKLKFLILFLITVSLSNCNSQTNDNPNYLGAEFGKFNLDNVTFHESVDTLFSKVQNQFYKNQIKNEKKEILGSQVFYDIDANKEASLFFIDEKFVGTKPIFVTDKNNNFFMISSSFKSDFSPEEILEKINNKYKEYEIKLKDANESNHIFQWETPSKIIVFKYVDQKRLNYYLSYITILNKSYLKDNPTFPFNRFSNSAPICLEKSCKKL